MDLKKVFIFDEFFTLSWSAGVSRSTIYKKNIRENQRLELKKFVKNIIINDYLFHYKNIVNDVKHVANIENISYKASKQFSNILHFNRFRIGTSQKILNLYLKYLWCFGEITKPPHCPIDGLVLEKLKQISPKNYKKIFSISWTKLDNINQYNKIIDVARYIVGEDLSEWELNFWSTFGKVDSENLKGEFKDV